VIVSIIASITRAAAAFGKSALAATASINSDLFTMSPCFSKPVNYLSWWFAGGPAVFQSGSKNCGEGQLSGGARRSGCVQRPLYTKRPKVVSTETATVSGC
jgi:hypothetical protein